MEGSEYEFRSEFNERYSLVTRKMLRALSENSRVSVSDLARMLDVSRITVRNRLRDVESKLGVQYTAELDEGMLGLSSQHLIVVKFDSQPDYGKIGEMLRQSYIPQLAVSVKGSYDMIIYALSTSSRDYAHWDKSMQILLSEYGVDWKPSDVAHRQLGFFPLRDELLAKLDIPEDYKGILRALHSDSRTPFRQISKSLGMHFNTVAYNFNKLVKSGYIKRFTITAGMPPDVTLMSFFAKYRPREGYEDSSAAARKAFMSDDRYSLFSRYLMCAPLIGSYDFFTLGAFDSPEVAYRNDVMYHKSLFLKHGIRLAYGAVDRVILGRLPIRSIDVAKEYNKIFWKPGFSTAR